MASAPLPPRSPAPLPAWQRAGNWPFLAVIYAYRLTLSPFLGGHCRFQPTCSRYGLEAYHLHGPVRGSWLTLRRVCRCHPFGPSGYDPVPLPSDAPRRRTEAPGPQNEPHVHAVSPRPGGK